MCCSCLWQLERLGWDVDDLDRGVTLCDWIADLISWSKDAMI